MHDATEHDVSHCGVAVRSCLSVFRLASTAESACLQVLDPGSEYIKNGAEPRTLAASAAVGFCNGLCPLLGMLSNPDPRSHGAAFT